MRFDGYAMVGPFSSRELRDEAVAAAFRAVNVVLIDEDSFRPRTDYMLRTFDTSSEAWVGLPASIARHIDAPAIACELVYDPANEWGAPIGYAVHALDRDAVGLVRGALIREHRGDDVHPDDGAFDGLLEELRLRAGDAERPKGSLAYYSWGDSLDDDFLDHLLHATLAGEVELWRPIAGGYTLQGGLNERGYRVELDNDDAEVLARAFEERTGRSLASYDRADAVPLGYARRRED